MHPAHYYVNEKGVSNHFAMIVTANSFDFHMLRLCITALALYVFCVLVLCEAASTVDHLASQSTCIDPEVANHPWWYYCI